VNIKNISKIKYIGTVGYILLTTLITKLCVNLCISCLGQCTLTNIELAPRVPVKGGLAGSTLAVL
jgi:hypothetical protein